jgi:hypothetical protein
MKKNTARKSRRRTTKNSVNKNSNKKTSRTTTSGRGRTQQVVIKVQAQNLPAIRPTEADLAEPMQEGKKLAITPTWVSSNQIMRMVQRTPRQYVYSRPAKGGGRWNYVTGSYVEKVLNYVFGFMWDFEIIEHGVQGETVWVKGKLRVKDQKGHEITKMQFGRADIKYKRGTKEMLDFGNDLKAASTDSLKKCASLLGIASDIYGTSEYKEESGNDPRPDAPKDNGPMNVSSEEVAAEVKQEPHFCFGVKGNGCPYGNEEIDEATYAYSMKVYKKPLCRECQGDAK